MSKHSFDFAVFGSTPLAWLLAGFLARDHHKRVVLVGQIPSPFQLERGLDLSVTPVTRPETWALLKATTPETLRMVQEVGRGLFRRVDPLFVARSEAGIAALGHARYVASGYGFAVERLATTGRVTYRYRDAALLDRRGLSGAVHAWLKRHAIRHEPEAPGLQFRREGPARWTSGEDALEAAQVILAEDPSALSLNANGASAHLHQVRRTAILTEPVKRLEAPVVLHTDRGVALVQRASGALAATSDGHGAEALARLSAAFGRDSARIAGKVEYSAICSRDGGPVVMFHKARPSVIAGLGIAGAFLAPALARLAVEKSSEAEARYFMPRGAGQERTGVADWGSTGGVVVPA